MRIISKSRLRDYWEKNTQARTSLTVWYDKMRMCNARNIEELRKTFNSVDPVHRYTIFNVGGNRYRLITAIHYDMQNCYIRTVWTHAEYSKLPNQVKLKRGEL